MKLFPKQNKGTVRIWKNVWTYVWIFEKDKKEFDGLKLYKNSIYIESGNVVKDYKVFLDTSQSDIKGWDTIKIGDNEETVPVTYSNGKYSTNRSYMVWRRNFLTW